jgi:hypothetical protein
MKDKLKARPEMRTWNTCLLGLHYAVFVLGTYSLSIPEALRVLRGAGFEVSLKFSRLTH